MYGVTGLDRIRNKHMYKDAVSMENPVVLNNSKKKIGKLFFILQEYSEIRYYYVRMSFSFG